VSTSTTPPPPAPPTAPPPTARAPRRSSADVVAGALFVVLGAAFAFASLGYEVGSVSRMGPGFFPAVGGLLLVVLGLAVAGKGLVAGESGAFTRFPLRPVVMISLALVAFATTIDVLGFVPATFVTAVLAALAGRGTPLLKVLALAAGLTAGCYVIFVLLLQLRLPLFGS